MINRTFTWKNEKYRVLSFLPCVSMGYFDGEYSADTETIIVAEHIDSGSIDTFPINDLKLDPIEGNTND